MTTWNHQGPVWATEKGQKLVKYNTRFAVRLLKQLAKEKGENVFLSPVSISVAMAMLYQGCRGTTRREVGDVMGFGFVSDMELDKCFADLQQSLHSTQYFQLLMANRLYGQKTYNFLKEFVTKTRLYYEAELAPVDFLGNTEEARYKINRWVEERTNSKIKDLIPSGFLDTLTKLVLVNAIYFKSRWHKEFSPYSTSEAEFRISPYQKTMVMMMNNEGKFMYGYHRVLECEAVILPYVENLLSMVVLLPKVDMQADKLLHHLEAEDLHDVETSFNMKLKSINLYLPRFHMEHQFSLQATLGDLGMKDVFSQRADLSGIDSTGMLFLSQVYHKAYVDVNEKGTEAAAATGLITLGKGGCSPTMRVDHPFLFFIRDNRSKSVLFLGIVERPEDCASPEQPTEIMRHYRGYQNQYH